MHRPTALHAYIWLLERYYLGRLAGGVCGEVFNGSSLIEQCSNTGAVSAAGNQSAAGGVVCSSSAEISCCYNWGSVEAPSGRNAGGIVCSQKATQIPNTESEHPACSDS